METGHAAMGRKYGISESCVRKRLRAGVPLDAPKMSLSEAARIGNELQRAKRLRREDQRVERDAAWVDTIRAGSPHPWHKLLARMAA